MHRKYFALPCRERGKEGGSKGEREQERGRERERHGESRKEMVGGREIGGQSKTEIVPEMKRRKGERERDFE